MVRETYILDSLSKVLATMRQKRERFEVRISPAALKRIDILIDSGEYASRSDFIHEAICEKLAEEKVVKNFKEKLLELIRTDPDIREELNIE